MVKLRTAELFDIPDLVDLGRAMFQESRYRQFSYVPAKWATALRNVIPQELSIVAEDDGRMVGALVAVMGPHFFGDAIQSRDLICYVLPDHRGGRLGVRLIREYVRRAKAAGVEDIGIGSSVGVEMDRTERIYQHLGFSRVGGNYVYGGTGCVADS